MNARESEARESEAGDSKIPAALYYGLQPGLILAALAVWFYLPNQDTAFLLVIVGTQLLLGVLESTYPYRLKWRQPMLEKIRNVVLFVVIFLFLSVPVFVLYESLLSEPLNELRESLGFNIWPHDWPILLQIAFAFLVSEFLWYWIHRAEHRWSVVWRLSGHGAHHSFKRLGAINAGVNHPLELFFILLPSALLELFFGAGAAAAGAAMVLAVQTALAHTNMHLNTRLIGWCFTTPRYHFLHHSAVLEESNSNYGCSAIVWDRLFGTFVDKATIETGSGPTEPNTWGKFMMPLREPIDTGISPVRR